MLAPLMSNIGQRLAFLGLKIMMIFDMDTVVSFFSFLETVVIMLPN